MEDTRETIGKNIRILRKERGQTLKSLSNQVGLTYQQLSRIENGSGTSTSTLERIAAVLGVEIPVLLDEPEATLHRSIPHTKNFVPEQLYKVLCARLLDTIIKPVNDAAIDAFLTDIIIHITQNTMLLRNLIATHAGEKKQYRFSSDELLKFTQELCADFVDYATRISKGEYPEDTEDGTTID
ncbi:MAG: helix-turn-helix transcriptional regulator [Lachnospiraceae bacterium]|nr:helix-turn-helix transcriptional regulator [Lachnospiraceae bacterium]